MIRILKKVIWLGLAIVTISLPLSGAVPTITWTNAVGSALWNTSDQNWVGPSNYVDGYHVFFKPANDLRSVKEIYIGTAGPTPVNISPGTSQWSTALAPGGTWVMSGGGITGGATLVIGWDASVIFTNYGADLLTFTNGTVVDSGVLVYCPSNPGTYHFGTGPIIASQRGTGNSVGFKFMPTVAGCTLVNDFIVPAGGAPWFGTINGGKILGTLTLNGPLAMGTVTGPGASHRLDTPVLLTGNRTISSGINNGFLLFAPIDGGGTHGLSLDIWGNNDAYTDWSASILDDTTTPIWNIGSLTKLGFGNSVFKSFRDLGSIINLRTGCLVLGGLGYTTNFIRDDAALNLQGGKLLLRRDTTDSQTEAVGSINLQWGYSELRLSPTNNASYTLASAVALTRTNYATALVAAADLGGTNGASGSGRLTFPAAPPLIGGGGPTGSTTISIIPFLIGGTTIDAVAGINGDSGRTFVTYDPVSTTLRNLNTATEFTNAINGATPIDNVLRTTNETLTANATINSLVLDASARNITLSGAQILTLNSGALLFRGLGSSGCATVDVAAIDFAGGEGIVNVVDTAPQTYGNAWLTINSVIQNGALTKSGYGRLDLRGNNTFTGPFVVNSGMGGNNNYHAVFLSGTLATTNVQLYGGGLWLQANNRLPTNTSLLLDSRASLYFTGLTQTLASVRSGPSGGGTISFGATGQLTFNPPPDNTDVFSGIVSGGTLIKDGPNILSVAGNFQPTTLRLQGGILRRTTYGLGPSKIVFSGGMYELSFGCRDWTYASGAFSFESGSGGWSAKGGNVTVFPELIPAEWGVTPNFVLDGTPLLFNTPYSDSLVYYERGINLGSTTGTPQFREIRVADNPNSTNDYASINSLTGTATDKVLWKTGAGLLQIGAGSTYAGGTKISAGTIQISRYDGLGAAPSTPTTNVTFDGGGLQFSADVLLSANRSLLINPGKLATLDTLAATITVPGIITGGSGGASLLKTGSGTLTLSGLNNYIASNTLSNGTLIAGSSSALGASGNALTMAGATLDVSGQSLVIGALNGSAGALIVNNGSGTTTHTLTVDFAADLATFNGRLNNGATRKIALTKLGSGSLVLNGSNTYSGPTLVGGGTLILNGSNATASVTVNSGATLGGAGFIAGSVTIASNGTLSPGALNSMGTLTIAGNLTLQEGCHLSFDAGAGTCDSVVVLGTLTIPTNLTMTANVTSGTPDAALMFACTTLSGATHNALLSSWQVTSAGGGRPGTVWISGTTIVYKTPRGTCFIVR